MPALPATPEPRIHRLPNGVQLLVIGLPQACTAQATLFVRTGSVHERAAENGISHVVEHLVFKGTRTRDRRRINRDAEMLGADINAHTDKDHTAYHLNGAPEHAAAFVHMLADLVCEPVFPEPEIELERQVLLAEFDEDADDPWGTAFKLFDKACYGAHPAAWPVIGKRALLQRFSRAHLQRHVRERHHAGNVLLAVAGPVKEHELLRAAESALGGLPAGEPNAAQVPQYQGGVASRGHPGSVQAHMVLGGVLGGLAQTKDDLPQRLAATVLGEGMSSPLMERLREEKGLAYYAAASADLAAHWGQLVIEVSTEPRHLPTVLTDARALLHELAERVPAQELQRAKAQLAQQRARRRERPARLLEDAVQEWWARGQVRAEAQWQEALAACSTRQVAGCLGGLLDSGLSAAFSGRLPRGWAGQAQGLLT